MRIPLPAFLRRSSQPRVTREQALTAVPVRNPLITGERNEEGRSVLTAPTRRDRRGRLLRWLFRVPPSRQIELDEVGSDVWEWCDGQNSIEALVERLMDKYRLNPREAELSLTTFLQQLARKGLIGLSMHPLTKEELEQFRRKSTEAWEQGQRLPNPSSLQEDDTDGGNS